MDEVSGLRAHIVTLEDVNEALAQKLDTANAENVCLKQQVQSAEGLTETFKATLKETELQVRAKDAALEECIAILRTSRDFGAEQAEKKARAALTEKRVDLCVCRMDADEPSHKCPIHRGA